MCLQRNILLTSYVNVAVGGGNQIPGGGAQNSGSKRKSTRYPLPPWLAKKTTKRPFNKGGNSDGDDNNNIDGQSVGSNSINVGGSSDGNNNNIDGIGGKIPADGEDSVGGESATFPVFQPIEAELETEPPNLWSDSGGVDDSNGNDYESGSKGNSGGSGSSDYETRGGEIDSGSKGENGGSGSSDSGFGGGSSDSGSKGDRDYGGSGSDSDEAGYDQGSDEGRGPKFLPSDAETSTDDGRILVEGIPVVQTPTNESSQTLQTPRPTDPTTVSINDSLQSVFPPMQSHIE